MKGPLWLPYHNYAQHFQLYMHQRPTLNSTSLLLVILICSLCHQNSTAEVLLFSDSFDRADSTDINDSAGPDQSGELAPLPYTVVSTKGNENASIDAKQLRLNVPDNKGAQTRIVLDQNLVKAAQDMIAEGGFTVSMDVNLGTDWQGEFHGEYAFRLFLSSKKVVNSNIGIFNTFQALAIEIKGNGKYVIYSQGKKLAEGTIKDWNRQEANEIKLSVASDSFLKDEENMALLMVNNNPIAKDLAFKWTVNDDLYLGLEAGESSAAILDLTLKAENPTQ